MVANKFSVRPTMYKSENEKMHRLVHVSVRRVGEYVGSISRYSLKKCGWIVLASVKSC